MNAKRHGLHWILGVALLGLCLAPATAWAQKIGTGPDFRVPQEAEFVPGQLVVRYKVDPDTGLGGPSATPAGLERVKRASGGAVVYQIALPPSPATGGDPRAAARRATLEKVRELEQDETVDFVEPNYIAYPMAPPNDTFYPQQWHYRVNGSGANRSPGGVDLPPTWDQGTTGSTGVVVAVIDTGILPNHQDITGSPNLGTGHDFISDPTRANDGSGRDTDPTDAGDAVVAGECGPGKPARGNTWHGTHVAGTVGVGRTNNNLGVAGVNWSVRVVPVRVLGKCGGTWTDIADGIRWSAGVNDPTLPSNPNPARVINMSLGGFGSCGPTMQRAIDDAVNNGVTVVVAAGNEADDASRYAPASCNGVITVAASDYRGHHASRYSNFGSTVEIMAPGGDVLRDDDGDGNADGVLSMVAAADGNYLFYNGTSMAAPHVAGVAALYLAQNAGLTPAQVLARLQQTARPRDASHGCPPGHCGMGLLSAVGLSPLFVSVTPNRVEISKTGSPKEETVTVSVLENGQPKAGASVSLQTGDSQIASVAPTSGTTNSSGQVVATVRAVGRGETSLQAQHGGASGSATVKVPGLPLLLLAAAAAALGWAELRGQR